MPILTDNYPELDSLSEVFEPSTKPVIRTLTTTLTENLTLSGDKYHSEYDKVFSAGEEVYILYKMPTLSDNLLVGLQNRQFKSSAGEADLEILWYSTGIVEGTLYPTFNQNNGSLKTSKLTVTELISVASDGTIRERDFLNGVGQGSNSSGDISPDLGFRVYYPDTFFIAKITNLHNGSNRIHIAYDWVELPLDRL